MPFLAKMSTHLGGGAYPAKEPRSKSIYASDENYYPSKHEHLLYRNKNKIIEYDECEDYPMKYQSNGHSQRIGKESPNDADWLYHRSKEKFASWDIRELDDASPPRQSSVPKPERRSPREIADAEVEEIFVNGESPMRHRNGKEERSDSATRGADRSNGKSRRRTAAEPWSEEEDDEDDDEPPRTKFENRAKPVKNGENRDQLLPRDEACGSLKKKNERNAGLNLGFRAIVEKFRSKSEDKRDAAPRSRKQELVDEEWKYDGNFEAYPPKESKTERNHLIRDHEPRPRRRSPKDEEEEEDEEDARRSRDRHRESDRSKRRSYAFEATPEDFDVRIQKYERARREDPPAVIHRRNSFHERKFKDSDSSQSYSSRDRNGADVVRKSSLRSKDRHSSKRAEPGRSKPSKPKVSERHSRPLTPPLTPPLDQRLESVKLQAESPKESSKKGFSMREWYESNRQFAAKYLKEHSKVKELATSDVSARDEFVFGSPKDCKTLYEIEERSYRRESIEEDDPDDAAPRRRPRRRLEDGGSRRRRHRRESVEDEEDEEEDDEEDDDEPISRRSENYGRSFAMPSRKIWNYRDGV